MGKKTTLVNRHDDEPFDFGGVPYDEGNLMGEMMSAAMSSCDHQMKIALELTQLIVSTDPLDNVEEQTFSVFKKAMNVVRENYPIKSMMKEFED